MEKVLLVAGTRPELIKIAPIVEALEKHSGEVALSFVHSGQHFDKEMSADLIKELGLPKPDVNLRVRSGSHAEQTSKILRRLEKIIVKLRPSVVVAVGDTNTVLASCLASIKLHVPFAHVEAGLRCYDMTMPEEVNRRVADSVSTLLFAPSERAVLNLLYEGRCLDEVYLTGNTIVDMCLRYLPKAEEKAPVVLEEIGVKGNKPLAVITVHRVENADNKEKLTLITKALLMLNDLEIVFPIHPRTEKKLREYGLLSLLKKASHVHCLKPLGYLNFLGLLVTCDVVITDSGGVQEEAFCLGKLCVTLRKNTERPETVERNANVLVGHDPVKIVYFVRKAVYEGKFNYKPVFKPNPYGQGDAGEKIAKILVEQLLSGLKIEKPDYSECGAPIFTLTRGYELNKLSPLLLRERRIRVSMVYDEKGRPVIPSGNLEVVKDDWLVRLQGQRSDLERAIYPPLKPLVKGGLRWGEKKYIDETA